MAFQGVSIMDLKREFVLQANKPNRDMTLLCRNYKINRKTGYKWLTRFKKEGVAGLAERSRRRINIHPRQIAQDIRY